jgi:hypothetical protein
MALSSGVPRKTEQQIQGILINRLSQRAERAIGREIARAMIEAGKLAAQGEPMYADLIMAEHERRMGAILVRVWTAAGGMGGGRVADSFMKSRQRPWERKQIPGLPPEIPGAPQIDLITRTWIQIYGSQKITQITDSTRQDIINTIDRGLLQGVAERDLGRMIAAVAPTKSASRAQTIARTETHSASQSIALETANAISVPMKKIWIASQDDRTRPEDGANTWNHRTAGDDNGLVDLDRPFIIRHGNGSTEALRFPGDPEGSAANVINCRCVVGFELVTA